MAAQEKLKSPESEYERRHPRRRERQGQGNPSCTAAAEGQTCRAQEEQGHAAHPGPLRTPEESKVAKEGCQRKAEVGWGQIERHKQTSWPQEHIQRRDTYTRITRLPTGVKPDKLSQ